MNVLTRFGCFHLDPHLPGVHNVNSISARMRAGESHKASPTKHSNQMILSCQTYRHILKLGYCERVCIFIAKILTVLPSEVDGQMIQEWKQTRNKINANNVLIFFQLDQPSQWKILENVYNYFNCHRLAIVIDMICTGCSVITEYIKKKSHALITRRTLRVPQYY